MYQLQHRVDLAAVDLDKAIELSSGRGRAAENAFTQRGIIWKLRGNNERALEDFEKAAGLGNQFAKRQVDQFISRTVYIPSRASLVPRQAYFRIFSTECHFFMASGLFLQVVHMNPYAAICNEAIDKMMSGEYM